MKLICIKTKYGVDLLGAIISIKGNNVEVLVLAKQEYKNDLLWQWWIVMDQK